MRMNNKRRYALRQLAIVLILFAAVAVGAGQLLAPPASTDIPIPSRPLHATQVSLVRVIDRELRHLGTGSGVPA